MKDRKRECRSDKRVEMREEGEEVGEGGVRTA